MKEERGGRRGTGLFKGRAAKAEGFFLCFPFEWGGSLGWV